jgi:excisionase family DNA binding protein
MADRDYLTIKEAAAILDVPGRTIAYRLQKGFMQGEQVNPRLWLIARAEVERWKGRGALPRGRVAQRRAAEQAESEA